MSITTFINKMLETKENILRVRSKIIDKLFEAFAPQNLISVKDILLNREYEYLPEFELNKFNDKIIVDIEAHVGLFSLTATYFAEKIIAIEPHPINYTLLEINKIRNKYSNITLTNKELIGKAIPKVKVYNADFTSSFSILVQDPSEKFDQIDLRKINVERHEPFILSDMKNTLKNLEKDSILIVKCNNSQRGIRSLEGEYNFKLLSKKDANYVFLSSLESRKSRVRWENEE